MPLIFILIVLVLFFAETFFLGWGFVGADYGMQHLPWSFHLWKILQNGSLPLWTPLIHTGFPLFAEGQVGALYPLRLLLFFISPFKLAYLAEPVIHFFLGWIFTGLFLKKIGLRRMAALLGGMLFVFGSAYAGCLTNTVSVRVVIWLPLSLYLAESLVVSRQKGMWREPLLVVCALAAVFFCQWTGGFVQYAVYSQVMFIWYLLARVLWSRWQSALGSKTAIQVCFLGGLALSVGLALSAPQFLSTLELAGFSQRGQGDLKFALIGSWIPTGFLSLLLPSISLIATPFLLYIGLCPLALAVTGTRRRIPFFSIFFLLSALLCVGAALGEFNPLYVWALKLTGFYGFRLPAKWLVFAAFWLSALAAIGFDTVFQENRLDEKRKQISPFFWVSGLVPGLTLLAWFVSRQSEFLRRTARWYLERFIYDHPYHPHSVSVYLEKVESLLNQVAVAANPFENHWLLISLLVALALSVLAYGWRKSFFSGRVFQWILLFLVVIDLYAFSFYGTGFRGNLAPMPPILKTANLPSEFKFLEKVKGRLFSYAETMETYQEVYPPDMNMLHGVAAVGAYSPLVTQRFIEYMGKLGGVDDSLEMRVGDLKALKTGMSRLNALNATHLYSARPLSIEGLQLEHESEGHYFYRNLNVLPRLYPVFRAHYFSDEKRMLEYLQSSSFRPAQEVLLFGKERPFRRKGKGEVSNVELRDREIRATVTMEEEGFLIISDLYYPGWVAQVNGKRAPILRANYIMRGIRLSPGRHDIHLTFEPEVIRKGVKIASAGGVILLMLILLAFLI